MLKIVAIADLHGELPKIPECDLLLIGGDVCPVWNHERRYQSRWLRSEFSTWLIQQPAKAIVGIGGNHDFVLQESKTLGYELPWIYLDNSEFEVNGLKIWGSPYSPKFGDWAFMREDRDLVEIWDEIPEDVNILMVHGPMQGILDYVPSYTYKRVLGTGIGSGPESRDRYVPVPDDGEGRSVGSSTLRWKLEYGKFSNLKIFVCGHIHEGYGTKEMEGLGDGKLLVINASLRDGAYEPVNPPIEFSL